MTKQEKKWLIAGGALLGLLLWSTRAKGSTASNWASIVHSPVLRSDTQGDGSFGASRKTHTHQGVDIEVQEGQTIYAPFSSIVNRIAYPYASDLTWKGVELFGVNEWDGYRLKIFYMVPNTLLIGQSVMKGQPIGYAQAISKKYTPAMQDHVHVELWKGSAVIDPTRYIFN
jgi:murein DD-endopeptidase MepM/ murein hydrolase activator NlpD